MHGFRGKLFPQKDLWGALSVPPIQQRPQPLGYLPLLVDCNYLRVDNLCQPCKHNFSTSRSVIVCLLNH